VLDKSIKHGKSHKKPYTFKYAQHADENGVYNGNGAKAVSTLCRNNNWCPSCRKKRLYNRMKTDMHSRQDVKDYAKSI